MDSTRILARIAELLERHGEHSHEVTEYIADQIRDSNPSAEKIADFVQRAKRYLERQVD